MSYVHTSYVQRHKLPPAGRILELHALAVSTQDFGNLPASLSFSVYFL